MTDRRFRTVTGTPVAAVTAAEMRDVDRVAVEDVGLPLLSMMENAGRTLARHARDLADGDGPVVVVAGGGGNGGGGLACARHLANHGVATEVVLHRDPATLEGAPATQYRVLDATDVPTAVGPDALAAAEASAAVVDALVGYGLSGAVRDPVRSLVAHLDRRAAPTLSLDVPSGVDATSGEAQGASVVPDRTVTLALPKTGLAGRDEPLFLADIGIPAVVYDRLDLADAAPFGGDPWVRLRDT